MLDFLGPSLLLCIFVSWQNFPCLKVSESLANTSLHASATPPHLKTLSWPITLTLHASYIILPTLHLFLWLVRGISSTPLDCCPLLYFLFSSGVAHILTTIPHDSDLAKIEKRDLSPPLWFESNKVTHLVPLVVQVIDSNFLCYSPCHW